MKTKELIEKLSKFDGDEDVCVFDWKKHIDRDNKEDKSVGLYKSIHSGIHVDHDRETVLVSIVFDNPDID